MKYIIKPRGLGKTTDLIRLAAANDLPIITVGNPKYIMDLAKKMDYEVKVFTLSELRNNKLRGLKTQKVLIDETDYMLQALLKDYGVEPVLGTLTIEG